ncbi:MULTISPECIES: HlyD family secretion protein [unclassified Cupriavidus]|uniref:HlyD family secretion protein n=1 Tax=unclassified Cupriavidus TaxID=2640874 RepID=UPI001C004B53|nr:MULTISPECIES: HlyD family secretion protein [unclassified Cupriavidus]MCA3185686.1 HlyD family secretion protein [Cupriavidus sp.]MCA3191877.1 HlyD family secretion protein [Cupriavidus sp.]MCA3198108.1 HlyD family secretion protein [Cupriavidus sp.]MCA3200790.1 HlyD family secretion protein [Cupriavidus sp.]MCA3208555.1 HlyD family secretion protein [Cupriavidus sp.]
MNDTRASDATVEDKPVGASAPPGKAEAPDPSRKALKWVAALIVLSLTWYLLADRFTPYTQQARVQAFVIPVAAEVPGRVTRVYVRNNENVAAGTVLFDVDPQHYRIALDRARADLETTRRGIGANTAGIDSARASLRAAQANELKARQDSERLERLYREDPGTISVRRLEVAQATHTQAISQVAAARAEIERAREQQGGSDDDNAKLRSAAAAVDKAELDLANAQVKARTAGLITDLRTEAGQYAAAGSPLMTLIAIHDVWISADMTENNLGHLAPGSPVGIVLDALPGTVLTGKVRSIGFGVSAGQTPPPGTLPTIQNSRDWLRPAQRFPVIVDIDPGQLPSLRGVRVGGQAEVMAFPDAGNPLNWLGRAFLRVMSWVSYVY